MFLNIRAFMFFLLMAGPCCALAPKMAMPLSCIISATCILGVEKNLKTAKEWFQKSANAGDQDAAEILKKWQD